MNKNPQIACPPIAASKVRRRPAILAASLACALGLVAGLSPRASAQNLIQNGGFETGNFNGWTTMPATDGGTDFGVFFGLNSQIIHSGTHAAFFAATGKQFDSISQPVPTFDRPLLKGEYQISFFVKPEGGSPAQFQALWNGHVIFKTVNTPGGPFQHVVVNQLATGNIATLTFQGLQVPDEYELDDVSVTLIKLEQGSFLRYARWANLTPNQRSVAGAIDSALSNSKSNALVRFLDCLPCCELPCAFDRISPDQLTSIFTLGTAINQEQSMNVQRRTDDLRSGASGFNAANLAINGTGPSFSGSIPFRTGVAGPSGDDGKEVKESKEMKQVAPVENRWGAFLSGTGEWVSVGDTNNARGYEIASGGFTLGVDYKVCPNFAIGLMGGYTGTSADLADGGRVYVNGGKLGIYATTFVGGWYADVAAIGGYDSYDTHRSALQGTARGDTDGGDLNVLFGTGYDFKAGGFTFGPTGSFNYSYVGMNAFNESGSLAPLTIHSGNGESLHTAFGLKMSYDIKAGGIVIKPEVRAAWQHEYGDNVYAIDSSFANGAGSTFTVHGPEVGRDSCLLGAGFAIQFNDRCATYFYYDGELGRKNYESNAVTGGVRIAF